MTYPLRSCQNAMQCVVALADIDIVDTDVALSHDRFFSDASAPL